MKLSELLGYLQLDASKNSSVLDIDILSVCLDSRTVKPGSLFIAVPGIKTDGRKYIPQAIAQGAAVVLAEAEDTSTPEDARYPSHDTLLISYPGLLARVGEIISLFYQHPSQQLKIVGITGTNGKTSTCYYIAKILAALGQPCGMMGTIGIGLPDNLITSTHTTADQLTLQAGLDNFRQQKINHVAMEVSSHGLEQQRVAGVVFDTVVFTNLTQDHADYHSSKLAYWQAKLKLFLQYKYRHAVVNLDDPFGRQLVALLPAGVKITGISLIAQRQNLQAQYLGNQNLEIITAHDIEYGLTQITAGLVSRSGSGELSVKLLGEGNLYNVLTAIAVCLGYGHTLAAVLPAANNLVAPKGRMQRVNSDPERTNDFSSSVVIVDYAHTPAALTQALLALRRHCQGKLYCVFGCGGDRDRSKRPLMLAEALKYSDEVIVTQDNPRTEPPEQILADMLADYQPQQLPAKLTINLDRSAAIKHTITTAKFKDIVLIAGKGHEDYQLIGNQVLPFSDFEVASLALAGTN